MSHRKIARPSFTAPLGLVLLLAGAGANSAAEPAERGVSAPEGEAGFVSLFNGKDLSGWEGKEGIFRVSEGAIWAGTLEARIPRNEFLCSDKEYGDFELRLQARLSGPGANAGVQFRSQRIANHHEVIGYQCDMGSMTDRPIWGSLYDESRRRVFLAQGDADKLREVLRPDDWNELVIRCEGPRIQIWVNGLQTVDYTEADNQVARRGKFGLQIHGGEPAVAGYRKIRLKELPGAAGR